MKLYEVKFKFVDGGLEGEISRDGKSQFSHSEALKIAQEENNNPACNNLYIHWVQKVA